MTRYGTTYKQGDILLVSVPFTDLTSEKRRPVLVISSDSYNNESEDIIVVAVVSNVTFRGNTIPLTNSDLREGTLKLDSCIRADKIYTLAQRIVMYKFGTVKDHVIQAVREKISELID
jgi:mRNA interferase MazF